MITLLHTSNAIQLVKADVARNRIAHSYLCVYQDLQILPLALKEIAKIILGNDARVNALVDKNQYIDCKFYPQEGKKIVVADVNAILEDCYKRPLEGDKKIYICNNVQEMQPIVQNKLLKILEEPPKDVYFILGTTEMSAVLQTIQSRTRKIAIDYFAENDFLAFVQRNFPAYQGDKNIYYLSNGKISNCLQWIQNKADTVQPEDVLKSLSQLYPEDFVTIMQKYSDKESVLQFFACLQLVLRDILFFHIGNKKNILLLATVEELQEKKQEIYMHIENVARRYKPVRILLVQDKILQALEDIKYNGNYLQALQVVLLTILEGK